MRNKHKFKVGDVVTPENKPDIVGVVEDLIFDPFDYPACEVNWGDNNYRPWIDEEELVLLSSHQGVVNGQGLAANKVTEKVSRNAKSRRPSDT